MAGLGRRTFAPGEVLTSTNVMGYLQDQAVMTFAGTAARGSAIGTAVSEGMVSYLKDTDTVQVYDGSLWRNFGPANNIEQIVSVNYSTTTSNSTTTYADTGLSATITPKFSTSKILVLVSHPSCFKSNANIANGIYIQLLRGASVLTIPVVQQLYTATALEIAAGFSFNYLDSPNTTSATTYKTQFRNQVAASQVAVQLNGATSNITLIEVSA